MKFGRFSIRRVLIGRPREHLRNRPRKRGWSMEGLEHRALLSGATVYTVDVATDSAPTTGGSGSGTTGDLRYCITQANSNTSAAGSVIQFAPSVFKASKPQTITLGGLTLSEKGGAEVIDGPGAKMLTLSGGEQSVVLTVNAGVTASISGLTIANGWGAHTGGNPASPGGGGTAAGGINNAGTLTVTSCDVNHDAGSLLGGIFNSGRMTISASTVANSFADAEGLPYESAFGGGIDNAGTMTILNSTIANNSAYNGGGIYNSKSLTITGSTISGNVAALGGGIHNNGGTLMMANSTVAANAGEDDGSGIETAVGLLKCVNCTIAYNTGGGGGFSVDSGTAILDNTIVALNNIAGLNQQGGAPLDVVGTLSPSSAHNLITTGGSGGLKNKKNGNHIGVAKPLLGNLANNGGPTATIALLKGSPALNAGSVALAVNPATNQPLTTDQRGLPRKIHGTVDIGGVES